jgi:hypothetical protein
VALNGNPTNTIYRWLIGDAVGNLSAAGSNVKFPAPVWNVRPPANPAAPAAVQAVVPALPKEHPEDVFGEALWVKVFVTEAAEPVELEHLLLGDPAVPDGSEPAEIEIEWQLLQAGKDSGDEVDSGLDDLGMDSESITRRYEFYKYIGPYNDEGEAKIEDPEDPAIDPILFPNGVVGEFLGAQNAALNLAAFVPEPTALALVGMGLAGLARTCRRHGPIILEKKGGPEDDNKGRRSLATARRPCIEEDAMIRPIICASAVMLCVLVGPAATAATTVFFEESQVATPVAEGVTWDTINSRGYEFTYTRDKLFTGGTGHVIGRQVRVPWPEGVEAQAVTTPPPGVTDYKARITLSRLDREVFDLTSFTAKLLASTAGAGGSIEIMPLLNGEDAFNDPLYFNASGYYGQTFSYDESPSHLGSTAALKGFDAYKIGLYVDFALTGVTLQGAAIVQAGDFDFDWDVDGVDFLIWQRGESPGGGVASKLADWKSSFGTTGLVAKSTGVPEPSTLSLVVCGLVGRELIRRRGPRPEVF